MARLLSTIKSWIVPSGRHPRTIKFGVFKGLKMNLDLRQQTQVVLGLAEREIFSHLRNFTQGARTGVDIGTLEGEFTLYYLSQPGIKHVLAFDPTDSFPASLTANLALNGLGSDSRVKLVKKFVADRDDQDHCTLDAMAANLEGPCVVKVDVDGGEGAVLKGADKMLARSDVSWIIETHTPELERECEQILKAAGLTTAIVEKAWWRTFIPEFRPIPHNQWLVAWRKSPTD